MYIRELMQREVITVEPDWTVTEIAVLMANSNIGAVAIVAHARLVGIFSERDLLKKVIGKRLDPDQCVVKDFMTTEVFTMSPDDLAEDALKVMNERHFRHIPIVDEEQNLVGIIGARDLMAKLALDLKLRDGSGGLFQIRKLFG